MKKPMDERLVADRVPRYLYKYCGANLERLRQVIVHREVYFPTPSELNDPFEEWKTVHFPTRRRPTTRQSRDLAIIWKWLLTLQGVPQGRIATTLQRKEHLQQRKISEMEAEILKGANIVAKTQRIYSASSTPSHMLLWAHYADGHRGVALKFDASRLISPSQGHTFVEVTYGNPPSLREIARCLGGSGYEFFKLLYTRKHKAWEYEGEWRGFAPHGNPYLPIEKGVLTGVIFGCKIAKDRKTAIKDFIRESKDNIRCYTACHSPGSFDFVIRPDK